MSLFQLLGLGLKTAISVAEVHKQAQPTLKRRGKASDTCTPCAAAARVDKARNFGQKK